MDFIDILSIVAGSLFFILLIVFMCLYFSSKRKYRVLQNELRNMYADKNTPKIDYDFAGYDEEVKRKLQGDGDTDGQLTIDDVLQASSGQAAAETVFSSVDVENVEEIKGNYKP